MRILAVLALCLTPLYAFAACTGSACNATSTKNTTFQQNLYVVGTLAKGAGSFMIDHPLDPKRKLLYHSFVESPDMKNIYDGVATLDKSGGITIELPDYFLALNKDFRYLASGIDQPMPNLHLAKGIAKGFWTRKITFRLEGGVAGGTISWQVTGIRHDPTALEHPIIPEVMKNTSNIIGDGQYLFPEFYGKKQ